MIVQTALLVSPPKTIRSEKSFGRVTQRFTQKRRKAGERKFYLDFLSNLFHIYYIFIFISIFYISLYFNIFFKLPSTLDMLPWTLDILPSTLDSRQLDTLFKIRLTTENHKPAVTLRVPVGFLSPRFILFFARRFPRCAPTN